MKAIGQDGLYFPPGMNGLEKSEGNENDVKVRTKELTLYSERQDFSRRSPHSMYQRSKLVFDSSLKYKREHEDSEE